MLDGAFESKARRRETTSRRTNAIRHGISARANAEHDESKHGRAAKRKTRGCQSEQDVERCDGDHATIIE